jgi:Zn-dependent protease with chaperone function
MRNVFKRKGGIVNDLVNGVGGLIISIILIFVVLSTLIGANLMTANSSEKNATDRMYANFTNGVDQISSKIPTIMLIGAVVLLFGVLVLLVARARAMNAGGNSGTL